MSDLEACRRCGATPADGLNGISRVCWACYQVTELAEIRQAEIIDKLNGIDYTPVVDQNLGATRRQAVSYC